MKQIAICTILIALLISCTHKQHIDLLLLHGRIYTVDSSFSVVSAMAVNDGKIIATGSDEELSSKFDATELLDLQDKVVIPGFIDAHCHFLAYGLGLARVDLTSTNSWSEVLGRAKAAADKTSSERGAPSLSQENGWLIGRGWDQNDWAEKRMPNNKALDSLFPDRPVLLTRIDGHAALANSFALQLSGVSATTTISGGKVELEDGKPTGLLIDNAVDLVRANVPSPSRELKTAALLAAQDRCFEYGITSVVDAGLMHDEVMLIDSLQKSGALKMRIYAMLSDSTPNYDVFLKRGRLKTERLSVCSFKFYADGALGSRGACLLKPYSDKSDWKGFLLSQPQHFYEKAKLLKEKGWQMNTHCIGDSAFRLMLDVCEKTGVTYRERWRIEHAQVLNKADLPRCDKVIPSVQPTHATSDMYWAVERLGPERVKGAYAYADLLKVSKVIALGTDFPVEGISPFQTFYAAVARKDNKGYPKDGWQMENALTREQTLRGMSIWAAYANFEEREKGSLEPGKVADFVILSDNILECKLDSVLKANVISCFLNGELVNKNR